MNGNAHRGLTAPQQALLILNALLITGFGIMFLQRANYEFVIYIGVIIFFLCLVGCTLSRVRYSLDSLVGLSVWSAMHLAGGGLSYDGVRLYDTILIPLSESYPIFRYDQLVHIWGFGAATLVMHDLLARSLGKKFEHPVAVGIVIVMAGLGVGAFNEIVEFGVSVIVQESGVGGYVNTSLDLCADLVGALLGLMYIRTRMARAARAH